MKTSVIGYPRIGKDRELKFASEKFFAGEIDEAALQAVAKQIRKEDLLKQKEAGITYISSNDFSFYDNVLDTAFLFNVIPQRYKDLGLSELETYFALARGYQGEKGNVKALAMKKWFNTNYHYLVPEIDDDTEIEIRQEGGERGADQLFPSVGIAGLSACRCGRSLGLLVQAGASGLSSELPAGRKRTAVLPAETQGPQNQHTPQHDQSGDGAALCQ